MVPPAEKNQKVSISGTASKSPFIIPFPVRDLGFRAPESVVLKSPTPDTKIHVQKSAGIASFDLAPVPNRFTDGYPIISRSQIGTSPDHEERVQKSVYNPDSSSGSWFSGSKTRRVQKFDTGHQDPCPKAVSYTHLTLPTN